MSLPGQRANPFHLVILCSMIESVSSESVELPKSLQWLRQGVREDMYEDGGRVDRKGNVHDTV